jgi:uncharacterized protein YjbI with pentapeptide repeats
MTQSHFILEGYSMANQEQLKILKQGAEVWNKWRQKSAGRIDLSGAKLNGTNLKNANLSVANLLGSDLSGANLVETDLSGANLWSANFSYANLNGADIVNADLHYADFGESNLHRARLYNTNLNEVNLSGADLSYARIGVITLVNTNLSDTKGLESIEHIHPSSLGFDTLQLSKGKIPEIFLRGCGLSDWEIEAAKLYNPNLTNQDMDDILYKLHDIRAKQPIQISKPFISHSHKDNDFVARLEKSLNDKGIRYWLDIHDSTSGTLEEQIDRAINRNPIVLVVLSENSIKSDWVQHEVRKAREIEIDTGQHVLCPVRLDDSFFSSPWPERIKEQVMEYNILDFSEWEDDERFEKMFVRRLMV